MAEYKLDLEDLEAAGKYLIKLYCSECQGVILESIEMTGDEIRDNLTNLVLTAPLNAPKCPKGCPATYSDCNQNYDMRIEMANGN